MKVLESIGAIKDYRKLLTGSVGFVPTMGALHKGHQYLLEKSVSENQNTILSIFTNPTQFNNLDDLNKYPKTLNADLELAKAAGVNAVFLPKYDEVYPDNYRFKVTEIEFSKQLCGQYRPGHFDGVLTVVLKLLNLCKPHRAYFGEKDFQQLSLIKDMVDSFFIDCDIIPVPTVREESGLAFSSRNILLSAAEKEKAPKLFKTIYQKKNKEEAKKTLQEQGFKVEYLEDINGRRYVAAWLGEVRLIDNVQI